MSHLRKPRQQGNKKAVFVDGVRTPFVKSFGVFKNSNALSLFSRVVDALTRRIGIESSEYDEVICGTVIPQIDNPNVARDSILSLGLGDHIHGYTLNRACTSSLQTTFDAVKTIAYGDAHLVLSGGVETLSDVPIVYSKNARRFLLELSKARSLSQKLSMLSRFHLRDWLPSPPGLNEPLTGFTMGEHAEMMAKINEIKREDQDALALRSHQYADRAWKSGAFASEVVPVWTDGQDAVSTDNLIRGDTSLESLAKLKPVFDRKMGSITAGNASPLTDGASVCLIGDQARVEGLGLTPKSLIRDACFVGVQPHPQLLIGPAIAIPLLLKRNGLSYGDIDFFEIHEAFAAQVLTCLKLLNDHDFHMKHFGDALHCGELPIEKINVNGGAIAIGHPFGATGVRLLTTLSNELIRTKRKLGLIAVCAAGGMASAMLVERMG